MEMRVYNCGVVRGLFETETGSYRSAVVRTSDDGSRAGGAAGTSSV